MLEAKKSRMIDKQLRNAGVNVWAHVQTAGAQQHTDDKLRNRFVMNKSNLTHTHSLSLFNVYSRFNFRSIVCVGKKHAHIPSSLHMSSEDE